MAYTTTKNSLLSDPSNAYSFLLFLQSIWSNYKLKTPDQWLWTCRPCWVDNTKKVHRCI